MNQFEELKNLKDFILPYTMDCNIRYYDPISHYYTVHVWIKGKSTTRWTVHKIYCDFLLLFSKLIDDGFDFEIPPKILDKISLISNTIEDRRKILEIFVRELISNRIYYNTEYFVFFFLSDEILYDKSSILLKANMVLRISTEFEIKSNLYKNPLGGLARSARKHYFTGNSIGLLSKKIYMIQLCAEYKLKENCRINSARVSHLIISVKSPIIFLPEYIHTISSTLCIFPLIPRFSLSNDNYNYYNPSGNYYNKFCKPNGDKVSRSQFSDINSWIAHILYGLSFLHENELYHGNLYFGNVQFGGDNIVKLNDFHSVLLGYHHCYINFFIIISAIEDIYQIDIFGYGSIVDDSCHQYHQNETLNIQDDDPLIEVPPDIENLLHLLVVDDKINCSSVMPLIDDWSLIRYKCDREKLSTRNIQSNTLQEYKTVSDQDHIKNKGRTDSSHLNH